MAEKRVECPKCRKAMEAGFLLGYRPSDYHQPTHWVDGVPVKSIWSGISVKKRRILPLTTYRCVSCGFLESYATGIAR